MKKRTVSSAFLLLTMILTLALGSQLDASAANAVLAPAGGDISIDFVAAGPFSYDRTTGVGGEYGDRTISKTTGVVESLEGADLECGDIIVFFDAITVDDGASAGASTIEVVNSYNKFTTSGGGVGFFTIHSVTLQMTDSAYTGDGDEIVNYVDSSTSTQTIITATIEGVEAGETIILREEVVLQCSEDPANVTGNVQTAVESARVIGGGTINTGQQTVPLKGAGSLPTFTPTATDTPTSTPTDTPTNTPTDTPTNTPTDTPTNTPTDTPTNTPTDTPTNTPTDTPTNTPTDTPTNTPTDTPTNTPTDTPTNTPTDTPTNTPTDTPTNTPTDTPTNTPTDTPTSTPTNTPTSTPTFTPTPTPNPFQGCTPGYWKQSQHFDSWVGYSPNQTLESVFDVPNSFNLDNKTLLQALGFKGGTTTKGSAQILLRAAVAALLNASSPDVAYPLTEAQIIAQVNAALASGNRSTMLTLAAQLDAYNNYGCTLN